MPRADFDSVGIPREVPFDTTQAVVLTVPADRLFELLAVAVEWGASSSMGARRVTVRVRNQNNQPLFQRRSLLDQLADESIRYVWAPGMPDEAVAEQFQLLQPMPLLFMEAAGIVDIRDVNSVDAADTVRGSFIIREYTIAGREDLSVD